MSENNGWYTGFVKRKEGNEIMEIYEFDNDNFAISQIFTIHNSIDEAIEYLELLIKDLKGQRENRVEFIDDGDRIIRIKKE